MIGDNTHMKRDVARANKVFCLMQQLVVDSGGFVRQFIFDDKGCVFIAVWGTPSCAHDDDATRAVTTAMEMIDRLHKIEVVASIGVTTGRAFCVSYYHHMFVITQENMF